MPNMNDICAKCGLNLGQHDKYKDWIVHPFIPQKGETEMKKETEKKRYATYTEHRGFEQLTAETEEEARVIAYQLIKDTEDTSVELFELRSLGVYKAGLVEVKGNG